MKRSAIRQHLAVYLVMGLEPFNGREAEAIARLALEGGVTLLQLREKHAPMGRTLEAGRRIRRLCSEFRVPFLVNDRVDLALLLEADGVHLGQDDIPCPLARKLLGPDKIIGVSAGTMEEALQAAADGADYLGVGSIYPTSTKADAGEAIGTSLVSEISERLRIPLVGIGGIDSGNAAPVFRAGADGVAVVSAIIRRDDPREGASRLRALADAIHIQNVNK